MTMWAKSLKSLAEKIKFFPIILSMETIKIGSRGEAVKILQKALHLVEDGIFGPLTEEAVIDFQKEHGLVLDGIVGDRTWEALGITSASSIVKKSKRSINLIVVHCSATYEGKDYTVAEIRKWHLKRGFSDIGYHYVIYRDGSIHEGRNVDKAGAHTAGYNTHSIGICYIGGLDKNGKAKDTRTKEQKASMLKLLKELRAIYPKATIHGHYEYAKKSCPCFNAKDEYKSL